MKDKRIWQFKRRAEEDNLITAGACRLILRIASWRYCTKHHPADAEFALSWTEMAAWYDYESPESIKDRKTIYDWTRELVLNKYLSHHGRKGCPPKSCYTLNLDYQPERMTLFDWAATQAANIVRTIARKNGQSIARKNRPPKYTYSLREEMYNTKGKKIEARCARKATKRGRKSSSLRSTETMSLTPSSGKGASTVPTAGQELPREDRAPQECAPSARAKADGANPPAGGGKSSARSAAADYAVALHSARFHVEQGLAYQLEERHVRALISAGDPVPEDVRKKFSKLFAG